MKLVPPSCPERFSLIRGILSGPRGKDAGWGGAVRGVGGPGRGRANDWGAKF